MSRYIDGFVIPVPKDRIDDYRRTAEKASTVWKEHGALDYWECVGDDLVAMEGMIGFKQLADAKDDETVVFAWVVFESREARDEANKKIMADPRLKDMMDPENQVFDCKRMAYGGFKQLVHA
ncbi:MAG: DUF1428 domain-containing protein [Planctomycetota bacterium]